MSRRLGGVLVLSSLLVLTAACSSTSDRSADQPSSTSKSTPKSSGTSSAKTEKPAQPNRDPKAKPKVDPAKASPPGLNVRYLKDGKVTQVDVPDFEH